MSEPTTTTPPNQPGVDLSAEPGDFTSRPVTEPKLDVQPPWTVYETPDADLPKELVGAYLHG
jgi:hypothetical protein